MAGPGAGLLLNQYPDLTQEASRRWQLHTGSKQHPLLLLLLEQHHHDNQAPHGVLHVTRWPFHLLLCCREIFKRAEQYVKEYRQQVCMGLVLRATAGAGAAAAAGKALAACLATAGAAAAALNHGISIESSEGVRHGVQMQSTQQSHAPASTASMKQRMCCCWGHGSCSNAE